MKSILSKTLANILIRLCTYVIFNPPVLTSISGNIRNMSDRLVKFLCSHISNLINLFSSLIY